ncbi:4'-phosphopantetheinyl transferase superfamily protein [Fulvivirga maritima]|uniref:4'-phosphopantetheinyl transferase family protein n=1 Tax=Fulvivirga maritima TaxID=2904247 RepID=UPI001F261A53|nr:4'-phosphopantetheinyl transferase superfamily protein [Fulvivirga maritima]UII26988.1 4'-phosphopantetheinyl transferase superfamily protein [Fulvivirga maritima]
MVLITYTSIASPISESIYSKYQPLLSTYDQHRLKSFIRKKSADATLAGRILLLENAHSLNYSINLSDIKTSTAGKPYLPNGPFFSISHSAEYVVCAISADEQPGIDIEKKRPFAINGFQDQFSDKEWETIISAKDQTGQLLKYWCVKEALLKKIGMGLEVPMKEVFIKNDKVTYQERDYYSTIIPISDEYSTTLVTSNKPEYEIRPFNLQEVSIEN